MLYTDTQLLELQEHSATLPHPVIYEEVVKEKTVIQQPIEPVVKNNLHPWATIKKVA